jgi:hypothetical protein
VTACLTLTSVESTCQQGSFLRGLKEWESLGARWGPYGVGCIFSQPSWRKIPQVYLAVWGPSKIEPFGFLKETSDWQRIYNIRRRQRRFTSWVQTLDSNLFHLEIKSFLSLLDTRFNACGDLPWRLVCIICYRNAMYISKTEKKSSRYYCAALFFKASLFITKHIILSRLEKVRFFPPFPAILSLSPFN